MTQSTDILMRLQCTTRPDHALVHEAADEIERLRAQVRQLYDKMTCMCGSYMDHSAWEGHTPVSMYDYALEQSETECERLRALTADQAIMIRTLMVDAEDWARRATEAEAGHV